MHLKEIRRSTFLSSLLLCCGLVATAQASPWIEPGDSRLRHHITRLSDAGLIDVPINTWPLMWSGVINDVKRAAKRTDLSPAEKRALGYVHKAFTRQTGSQTSALAFSFAGRPNQLRGFDRTPREQSEVTVSHERMYGGGAVKLAATWATDVADGDNVRLDGSYATKLIGNWAIGVGAIDRWWGPGRENALILSNNARPVPSLFLQRNHSTAFESPWLSWIGPWNLLMFAGQLESDRHISEAKLLGMRLAIRPADWLEIGFSRTAQWGGDGRPQNVSSFKNVLLGKDNRGDDGIAVDGSNEPGNQVAGYDWRATWAMGEATGEFYGEIIGEDEAGGMPSRRIATFGLGTDFLMGGQEVRSWLEYSDTQTRRFHANGEPNVAYEHSIYLSGYRYHGRNLAASVDNDSKVLSLGLEVYPNADASLKVVLSKLDINTDGRDRATGVVPLAQQTGDGWQAKMQYQERWRDWHFGYGFYYQGGDFELREMGEDTGGIEFSAEREW